MNAARRKRLSALIDSLEDIKSELDEIAAEEASDNLQSAVSSLEELMEYIEEAKG